ncbi:hypothetical protein HY357_01370 [Candidatus Roizmanbacteria bacterium]|nr:hypothetical protein [Candidatus Roizmanbacteria bacterium]
MSETSAGELRSINTTISSLPPNSRGVPPDRLNAVCDLTVNRYRKHLKEGMRSEDWQLPKYQIA